MVYFLTAYIKEVVMALEPYFSFFSFLFTFFVIRNNSLYKKILLFGKVHEILF